MKKFQIGITIGYELRTLVLTEKQWIEIKNGKEFKKTVKDYYEGEEFNYQFHFNNPEDKKNNFIVTYDDGGEGYIGNIDDVYVDEIK